MRLCGSDFGQGLISHLSFSGAPQDCSEALVEVAPGLLGSSSRMAVALLRLIHLVLTSLEMLYLNGRLRNS